MGTTVFYMDTPPNGIAGEVDAALRVAGISRRDAAAQTGIPLTTLQRRMTGRSPFKADELLALASLAGVKVSDLWAAVEGRQSA